MASRRTKPSLRPLLLLILLAAAIHIAAIVAALH